jgi:hypothetical protein
MTSPDQSDRIRLLVYYGTGADTVPVSEYLDQHRSGTVDWTPGLSQVGMELTVGGHEQWPTWKTIGDLARTAVQWEAAATRLRAGETALVRIGIDDFPIGGYFRFTPENDAVLITSLPVESPEYAYRYPVDESGDPVPDVYEHILGLSLAGAELDEARDEAGLPALDDVAFPRDRLIDELSTESAHARELYGALGADFHLELY